jgi:UDP:flavonoid glycosyltransferase YjiC (YdhE family)
MARTLLLPHAPTGGLAHLGACLAVGGELRARDHEVRVAYGGTRRELIEREGFPWHRVPEVAAEREWHRDGWFGSTQELRSLVDAHLELLERVRPDVAVSSSGIAGRLACEVAAVPQMNLMHYVAITPYGRRAVVWGNRWSDARRPRRLLWVLRARGRSARRRISGRPTSRVAERVRAELGLPPVGRDGFAGARDSVFAITTAPFLDPARGLPDQWRYIGPLAWSPSTNGLDPPPERGDRPLVYVTQGSTGDPGLLRRTVSELASQRLDVVVTTGGLCDPLELACLGPNVRAAELLSGQACLETADVAVIHGGHLTFCQALLAGTPVVVMPHRGDQIGRVHRAERLGVGIGLWPRPRLRGTIHRAVRRLLETPGYRQRGAEIALRLRDRWHGSRNAADLVELLARSQRAT